MNLLYVFSSNVNIWGFFRHIWKQGCKVEGGGIGRDGRGIMFTFCGMVEELKRLCCPGLVLLSIP
jgi:hypothetical protein